jgi:hypothetical protein
MTTETINQIARHAEARASVQTIALTHPRAGEDLFRLQTDYPQLNFVRANGTDWHAHVAQAQAVLLGRSIAIDELLDHATVAMDTHHRCRGGSPHESATAWQRYRADQ